MVIFYHNTTLYWKKIKEKVSGPILKYLLENSEIKYVASFANIFLRLIGLINKKSL